MNSEWVNQVMTLVIIPILAALVPFIINYLNKLANEVKARMKDKAFEKYITIAEDAIETSVVAVMQTYVGSIKGTDAWNEETQKEAFYLAKTKAITIMGSAARLALKEVYEDIDAWIDSKIEECVNYHRTPSELITPKVV